MKKIGLFILALSLVLSLVACGGGSGKAAQKFIDIFASGTFHMKATASDGYGGQAAVEMYCKGDKFASVMEEDGETARMVVSDGKYYIISDAEKEYTVMDLGGASPMDDIPVTGNMTFVKSGKADFNGKNLSFEEYTNATGDTVQFFLDGNNLAGLRTLDGDGDGDDVIILVLDQNVPNSVFDIPGDYTSNDFGDFDLDGFDLDDFDLDDYLNGYLND
ncbi:MAG: hypothetical protein FWE80_07715 [Oscillospiraceae bacterium]|nr:hypothetical protein [Oscillospiraceae bacterium]